MLRTWTCSLFALSLALASGASAQEEPRRERDSRGNHGRSAPRAVAPRPRPSEARTPARPAQPAPRAAPRTAQPAPRFAPRIPTPPRASSPAAPSRGSVFGARGERTTPWVTPRTGSEAAPRSPRTPSRSPLPPSSAGRGPAPGFDPGRPAGNRIRERAPDAERVPAAPPARRSGSDGFLRPSPDRGDGIRGSRPDLRDGPRAPAPSRLRAPDPRPRVEPGHGANFRRYGYAPRHRPAYPGRDHHHYASRYRCSPYYARSGLYLSFTFGSGTYFGLSYYSPWYHCGSHYAFFYAAPLSYCYVPYGFYCDAPSVYVTRYVYVRDTWPTTEYEVVEAAPPVTDPVADQEILEPVPAAGSPVAEQYLRDASELFRQAQYLEAAKLFRLAAMSTPDNAAPYFAFAQSLIGIGSDAYAARMLRKAVLMNPALVQEPGDIVGVFRDQEEFARVMGELQLRAEQSPAGSDSRFLLAAERYFSGDPAAVNDFAALRLALPEDGAVALFADAAAIRFAAGDELPPLSDEPR